MRYAFYRISLHLSTVCSPSQPTGRERRHDDFRLPAFGAQLEEVFTAVPFRASHRPAALFGWFSAATCSCHSLFYSIEGILSYLVLKVNRLCKKQVPQENRRKGKQRRSDDQFRREFGFHPVFLRQNAGGRAGRHRCQDHTDAKYRLADG